MTLTFTKTIADWEQLVRPRASELEDTRNQLHWAAQIVAALGASLAAPCEDFSHTSLDWSPRRRGVVSQTSATSPRLRALLHFPEPRIELLREQADGEAQTVASVGLDGRRFAEVLTALEVAVAEQLGRSVALERPRHDLPDHRVDPEGAGEPFGGWSALALDELTRWYANGARAFAELREQEPRAGAIRCWPHHFDIATLIAIEREDPNDPSSDLTRSVGVGMTPGDASYADAYWYVNCWPKPKLEAEGGSALPRLASRGLWHRDGWVGAVLTATTLRDPQAETFAAFMREAIAVCEDLTR